MAEGIHAVDPEHCGKVDSTILYISSCILVSPLLDLRG